MAGIDKNTALILQGNEYQSEDWLHDITGRHILTAVGTAQPDSTNKKFGDTSALFDGNSDYLTIPTSTDFDIASTFSVDMWVRHSVTTGHQVYLMQRASDTNYWTVRWISGTGYQFYSPDTGMNAIGGTVSDNNWHHVLFLKIGTDVGVFQDGVQVGYDTSSAGVPVSASMIIGSQSGTTGYLNGNLNALRIEASNVLSATIDADGTSGSYTIPTTRPVADANTKLLCHFNEHLPVQDASYEILDSSKTFGHTGHVVTQVGTAQLSTAQKVFGDTSLLLDGNSDYLSILASDDWTFGTGDFTVECNIRFTSLTDSQRIVSQYIDVNNRMEFFKDDSASNNGLLMLFKTGGTTHGYYHVEAWTGVVVDTWYHIAFVRQGANAYIFIDGVAQSYTTYTAFSTNNIGAIATPLLIGSHDSANYVDGYIDELRISKGIARWTSNFTPETERYVADANTKLLLHCESQDNSAQADLTPKIPTFVGTAQIDTAIKRFGSGAYKFNGTTDYISLPDSSDWDIVGNNTDNQTVDFWARHTDHALTEGYVGQWVDNDNKWTVQHTHGVGLEFKVKIGGSAIITLTGAGEITDTEWHHIAFVKIADEYAIYKDGIQVGYLQDTSTGTIAGLLYIGRTLTTTMFEGYMDGIRIEDSNYFNASPNVGLTDTIDIPYESYTYDADSGLYIPTQAIIIM